MTTSILSAGQISKFLHGSKAYLTLLLLNTLFISTNLLAQLAPVNPPTGGFRIDGGLKANTPTANEGDWVAGTGGTGGFVLSDAGVPVNASTTGLKTDAYNSGQDYIFTTGSKFNDVISALQWTQSTAPNKNDINNGMYHVSTNPGPGTSAGEQWVMIGGDRLSTSGTSYIDFEFLQNNLTRDASGGKFTGAGPNGGRTIGDLVISMEYTGGGSTASVYFYQWTAKSGGGYEFVQFTPPSGTAFAQTNLVNEAVPFGAFGSTTYQPFAFVEAAINITKLLQAAGGGCTGLSVKTLWVKTKASSSSTAALKDFMEPIPVSFNFGSATIAYAGPYCTVGTASVTQTGTTGGTYSSTPSLGTSLNASTGAINLATATPGTYTIKYSFNAGGSCTKEVTTTVVINAPPTITGTLSVCVNGTSQLSGSGTAATSNPWVSSDNAIATVSSSGLVTGKSAGSVTITYTNSLGCQNTATVTVNALPTITGTLGVCVDQTTQLTGSPTAASSNAWASSNTAIATVSSSGLVTGKAAGTATITYTNSNGCQITAQITVSALPTANAGTDPAAQCYLTAGNTFNLTGTAANGTASWSVQSNPNNLTIVFTPNPPNTLTPAVKISGGTGGGTVTLRLTVSGTCGNATDDINLTVSAQVVGPSVTMLPVTCTDKTFSLQVNNPQSGTKYTLTQPGNTNTFDPITYSGTGDVIFSGLTFGDGGTVVASVGSCSSGEGKCDPVALRSTTSKQQQAQPAIAGTKVLAYPNPFNDRVRFSFNSAVSGQGSLDLYNMLGQKVKTVYQGHVEKGKNQTIEYSVPNALRTNLIYMFRVGNERKTGKLIGLK